MVVTVINSSPREKGITKSLLDSFIDGLKSESAIVNVFSLHENKMKFCDGCFRCWYMHPAKCKIKDNFNTIYAAIISSDYLLLASPIYGMMINGSMKTFLDRLSMVSHLPYFLVDEETKKMTKPMQDHIPPTIIVMVGNMAGKEIFDAASYYFDEFFRITDTNIAVKILRCQSELLSKPILENKKQEVYRAMYNGGKEFAKFGRIIGETHLQIEQELLGTEHFVQGHNMFWKICKHKNIAPHNLDFEQYPILKI